MGSDHQIIPKRDTASSTDRSKAEKKLYTFQDCDNQKDCTFNL